jgi:hypothetical protein
VVATVPASSPAPLPPKRSVTPPPSSNASQREDEVIAGVICWLPPGKRVKIWNLSPLLKSGILNLWSRTGFAGFKVSNSCAYGTIYWLVTNAYFCHLHHMVRSASWNSCFKQKRRMKQRLRIVPNYLQALILPMGVELEVEVRMETETSSRR